jgi:hypothetical protein
MHVPRNSLHTASIPDARVNNVGKMAFIDEPPIEETFGNKCGGMPYGLDALNRGNARRGWHSGCFRGSIAFPSLRRIEVSLNSSL